MLENRGCYIVGQGLLYWRTEAAILEDVLRCGGGDSNKSMLKGAAGGFSGYYFSDTWPGNGN
jgi:hypothetical protein